MVDFNKVNRKLKRIVGDIAESIRGVDMEGKKNLDQNAVKELFALLHEVKAEIKQSQVVDKQFVALLFYLYSRVYTEIGYTDFPEALFVLAGDLEHEFGELFGPSLHGSN